MLVTPAHGISYPSTSHIRAAIRKAGLRQAGGSLPVVIDCSFIDVADYTSAKVGYHCSADDLCLSEIFCFVIMFFLQKLTRLGVQYQELRTEETIR